MRRAAAPARGPAAAVAVAVALAAGAAGCGAGHPARGTSSTAPAPTASAAPTATGRLPALFSPSTVSFVSSTTGYALGVATCTATGTTLCVGLARTVDGGLHWVPATPPPLLDLADPLHQPVLRFADARTGFATDGRPGTGLLVTRDGGASWRAVAGLPATAAVTTVLVGGGHLLVVAGDRTGRRVYVGSTTAARTDAARTDAAAAAGTTVAPVGPVLDGTDGVVDAALSGERAYVLSSPGVGQQPVVAYRSTGLDDWARMPVPCPAGGTGRVAAAGDRVVLVCQAQPQGAVAAKRLWVSTDAGASFRSAGALVPDGYARAVALGSARVLTVAASSTTDELLASADGGRTYSVAYASAVDGDGQGLFDLEYVDAAHAFAVLGSSGAYAVSLASGVRGVPGPRLLASADGGAHWTQVQVRP